MISKIKSAQPNQSLIDGIATLQALAISEVPIGGRELARQLGFEHTRVNRILKTLAYLGIARQTANRKYAPGPGMHVLAAQSLFASGLIRRALPALESLRHFNYVVAFGVLWRDNVSYLYHAPPGLPSAEALGRIGLYPATKGGIGLALLAALEDDEIQETYKDRDIPNFPAGINALLSTLATIREQGFARVLVKPDLDQHTIAVTVGRPAHSAVAMSGWIPQARLKVVLSALRSAASTIEGSAVPTTSESLDTDPLTEVLNARAGA